MGTPIRSCLACRRRDDKRSLARLAAADGTVAVDPAARRPGRGAYLCQRRSCLDAALRGGGAPIVRALRLRGTDVTVDADALRTAWERQARQAAAVAARCPGTEAQPDARHAEVSE